MLLGLVRLVHEPDRARHDQPVSSFNRVQGDLGTEGRAIPALSVQLESRDHGPRARRLVVLHAQVTMPPPLLCRQQDLDLLPDEFARPVAEKRFRPLVRDTNVAFVVGNDRCIGRSV